MSDIDSSTLNILPTIHQAIHSIQVDSIKDSKIVEVRLYSGRAIVKRELEVALKTGINQLTILSLPSVLGRDTLNVSAKSGEKATVHGVSISSIPVNPPTPTPRLLELQITQAKNKHELARAQKLLASLDISYLISANDWNMRAENLATAVQTYKDSAPELDTNIIESEAKVKATAALIEEEIKIQNSRRSAMAKLSLKAMAKISVDDDRLTILTIKYQVTQATWTAGYDILVHEDDNVALTYKGTIAQTTGEDWENVCLILETTAPVIDILVPSLKTWPLSIAPNTRPKSSTTKVPRKQVTRQRFASQPRSQRSQDGSAGETKFRDNPNSSLQNGELQVSSKGLPLNAGFSATIPSDGNSHTITISHLYLGKATMSRTCVPSKDSTTVIWNATINNMSDYTLLAGNAHVYFDDTFLARSNIPRVGPGESFDCTLAVDPAIKVTYEPRIHKSATTGFFTKRTVHRIKRNITVYNAKPSRTRVYVVDEVPVSEEADIEITLHQPGLKKGGGSVLVSEGVEAMWMGRDSVPGYRVGSDTRRVDGNVYWTVDIPACTTTSLTLEYSISANASVKIAGLD